MATPFALPTTKRTELVRGTDRNGYSFHFEYDGEGRCTRARGEDGGRHVRLEHQPLARMTKVTEGDRGEWSYYYDAVGTPLQIIDPRGGGHRLRPGPADRPHYRITEQVAPKEIGRSTCTTPSGACAGYAILSGNYAKPASPTSASCHYLPSPVTVRTTQHAGDLYGLDLADCTPAAFRRTAAAR